LVSSAGGLRFEAVRSQASNLLRMELAARRYAQKVLLIHLALLLLAILVVGGAVKYMYRSARGQARAEALNTQDLLTRQTALGIENYYDSITSVLNLLQPGENELGQLRHPPPESRMSPEQREMRRRALESGPLTRVLSNFATSIWKNIDDKASMLFV